MFLSHPPSSTNAPLPQRHGQHKNSVEQHRPVGSDRPRGLGKSRNRPSGNHPNITGGGMKAVKWQGEKIIRPNLTPSRGPSRNGSGYVPPRATSHWQNQKPAQPRHATASTMDKGRVKAIRKVWNESDNGSGDGDEDSDRDSPPREESFRRPPPEVQNPNAKSSSKTDSTTMSSGGSDEQAWSKEAEDAAEQQPTQQRWDPRFDPRAGGDFDRTTFRKRYGFIEEMREGELKELKRAYKTLRRASAHADEDAEENEEGGDVEEMGQAQSTATAKPALAKIKEQIRRLENQVSSSRMEQLAAETRSELRRANLERMRQGKRPIYLNNQEMKKRVWEKRYDQLRKAGRLESFLEKRAKKGKDIHPPVETRRKQKTEGDEE